ncbi:unnamed protein product [Adineta ricciae]|uniref:Uncharacterized protein n=1 Tax=Adineta ricciae TaxID=249248 RepID=A0A815V5D1_ADIRI|nr:unnamed protein product [Adineta ricciae]CAF1526106.1 unnamed protein product [Adineta ricciae]
MDSITCFLLTTPITDSFPTNSMAETSSIIIRNIRNTRTSTATICTPSEPMEHTDTKTTPLVTQSTHMTSPYTTSSHGLIVCARSMESTANKRKTTIPMTLSTERMVDTTPAPIVITSAATDSSTTSKEVDLIPSIKFTSTESPVNSSTSSKTTEMNCTIDSIERVMLNSGTAINTDMETNALTSTGSTMKNKSKTLAAAKGSLTLTIAASTSIKRNDGKNSMTVSAPTAKLSTSSVLITATTEPTTESTIRNEILTMSPKNIKTCTSSFTNNRMKSLTRVEEIRLTKSTTLTRDNDLESTKSTKSTVSRSRSKKVGSNISNMLTKEVEICQSTNLTTTAEKERKSTVIREEEKKKIHLRNDPASVSLSTLPLLSSKTPIKITPSRQQAEKIEINTATTISMTGTSWVPGTLTETVPERTTRTPTEEPTLVDLIDSRISSSTRSMKDLRQSNRSSTNDDSEESTKSTTNKSRIRNIETTEELTLPTESKITSLSKLPWTKGRYFKSQKPISTRKEQLELLNITANEQLEITKTGETQRLDSTERILATEGLEMEETTSTEQLKSTRTSRTKKMEPKTTTASIKDSIITRSKTKMGTQPTGEKEKGERMDDIQKQQYQITRRKCEDKSNMLTSITLGNDDNKNELSVTNVQKETTTTTTTSRRKKENKNEMTIEIQARTSTSHGNEEEQTSYNNKKNGSSIMKHQKENEHVINGE